VWLTTPLYPQTPACHKQWISTWLWPLFELRRRRRTAFAYQPLPQEEDVIIAGSHVQGGYGGYGSGRFSNSVTRELCQQVSQEYGEYDWKTSPKVIQDRVYSLWCYYDLLSCIFYWIMNMSLFFSLAVLSTHLCIRVFLLNGIQHNRTCICATMHTVNYGTCTCVQLHICTPCCDFQYVLLQKLAHTKWTLHVIETSTYIYCHAHYQIRRQSSLHGNRNGNMLQSLLHGNEWIGIESCVFS
jgi:hypothetical protein